MKEGESAVTARSSDNANVAAVYSALSQQASEEYRERRTLEWKMHLALWTILSAIIYLGLTREKHIGGWAFVILLAVPIHFIWIIKIHRGQIREDDLSKYYRCCAERLLPKPSEDEEKKIRSTLKGESTMPSILEKRFLSYLWWVFIELGTTIIICIFAIRLLW
jgi:hypothetical protein